MGARRADFHRRIDQAGRADHLLDEGAFRLFHLPVTGRRRDVNSLGSHRVPFLEPERPIVHARRQAEAVFGQRRLAPIVAAIHAADLRHGHMALVGEHERVVGQILEQGRRRLAGPAAGQIARIVLDAGARAGRLQHFEIEQVRCSSRCASSRRPCAWSWSRRSLSSSFIPSIDCSSVGRGVT